MSTSNDCNGDASKSNDVLEIYDMLQNMNTTDDNNSTNDVIKCANCGKEGSDVTNSCNKCKMVMYCNAACKKKHRHKHMKECEEHLRLAAERAAELHDEKLFKQPALSFEDCPICFLRMPSLSSGCKYKSCCGKQICSGCIHAVNKMKKGPTLCPFCRDPAPDSDEEFVKRTQKRVDIGDAEAIFNMGVYYAEGNNGLPQDYAKALDWYQRAAELGNISSYFNIGIAYYTGTGVEMDKKTARHYWELAAMKGCAEARHNLGGMEEQASNMKRALKHFMIAAEGGDAESLKSIQKFYSNGIATKEIYTAALQAYQIYLGGIRSVQRDEAATASEQYRYY